MGSSSTGPCSRREPGYISTRAICGDQGRPGLQYANRRRNRAENRRRRCGPAAGVAGTTGCCFGRASHVSPASRVHPPRSGRPSGRARRRPAAAASTSFCYRPGARDFTASSRACVGRWPSWGAGARWSSPRLPRPAWPRPPGVYLSPTVPTVVAVVEGRLRVRPSASCPCGSYAP